MGGGRIKVETVTGMWGGGGGEKRGRRAGCSQARKGAGGGEPDHKGINWEFKTWSF